MAYTLGYSNAASALLAGRHARREGSFLIPRLRKGMHLLDCGCGDAELTLTFLEVEPSLRVYGVDIEKAVIRAAIERANSVSAASPAPHFVLGDFLALPFPASMFDVVFGHTVLMQLSSPGVALREAIRVLKPGGLLAFREPAYRGDLYYPENHPVASFWGLFARALKSDGGDPDVGPRLPGWLSSLGVANIQFRATYRNYSTHELRTLGFQLAALLDEAGGRGAVGVSHPIGPEAKARLRDQLLSSSDYGLVARAYCEVTAIVRASAKRLQR